MIIAFIRAVMLYAVVIFMIRLMGKRQIGELQPSELVITILISEVASLPMQDNSIPVFNALIALIVLVSFEIIFSALSLKFHKLRNIMQGHPVIVIRNGQIDQNALKELRLTVNDLISALRQRDVFDITEISYAVFETNGKISILLKPQNKPLTPEDMKMNPEDKGMPFAVICDGDFSEKSAKEANITKEETERILCKKNKKLQNILLMTVNKSKKYNIIEREKKK